MANKYGKDIKVKIRTTAGPTPVFTPIGGELSHSFRRSSQEVDLSDKDSGTYGGQSYGQQKITISVNGNVKLPDVGLQKVHTVAKSGTPEEVIQIVDGATVIFEGLCGIGNFSSDRNKDGPVTYSFDASNIGAPATDDLGAA